MNYLKIMLVLLSLLAERSTSLIAQENISLPSVWEGVGGKSKWESTKFILFTSQGNEITKYLSSERTFLIDKSDGRCRFEGKTKSNHSIVLLFNYKSKQLDKLYLNGVETKASSAFNSSHFPEIIEQFFQDSRLLFLPSSFDQSNTTAGSPSQKIINAEKTTVFPISSAQLFDGSTFNGKIALNTTSQIIRSETNQSTYIISGYKDVGGGLNLPTVFKHATSPSKHCIFTTVAAFTDMEEGKFTTL
ncbi:hypothetical protein FAZ15_10710 [Sphingobacterium olei]|uniref:T9SS C-terminal target domain-containing protein n=1 Tax=Sphingobacterium olei TaxID=2571155 RepID=A0A4U0PCT6_9SPHI|nr:hypothetical protein [Sphingobacterium olei]TJZ60464.1 hypothetical protein FAZ15_10710 [Sphingobacterium olei]